MAAETRCACWVLLWYLLGGFVMLPKLEPQLPCERTGKCGETAWEVCVPPVRWRWRLADVQRRSERELV